METNHILRDEALEEELDYVRRELAKRDAELAAVLTISHALSAMTNLDDLVRETLELSLRTLNAGAGALFLYDEKIDKLIFKYVINTEQPEAGAVLIGRTLEPGQGIAGQVFQTGVPVLLDDPESHPGFMRSVGQDTGYLTRNMITLPLITLQGKRIGAMQAINKHDGNFTEDDLHLLTILASQAVLAIESDRLYVEARAATIMHYLGDISHDIKNLMTPAQTGAQTLESIFEGAFEDLDRVCSAFSDHPLPTQVAKSCESLRQLFPEMIGMVTESIDAAQERVREIADALKGVIAEPVFEEGNVNEIILTVVKTLKGVAERRGVRLVAEDLGDVPEIPLDRKRLYSAIYNLTNNAIPETPEGGIIALRSDYAADGIFPEGEYVRVQVTDTGKGMTDEVKARLFTEHAISTKPGGTGLGTRIVKNVMDAHGGTVEVESCLGQGTTFTLKLPIRHESGLSTTHQM